MTQKEVAEYLGVTIRSYQRIESGDRTGEIQTWDLLEDLMNVMQQKIKTSLLDTNNYHQGQDMNLFSLLDNIEEISNYKNIAIPDY